MDTRKQERRLGALKRLNEQLSSGVKTNKDGEQEKFTELDRDRMLKEAETLQQRLSGVRKNKKQKGSTEVESKEKDRWVIDIFAISMGYVKNSERRKNKGKSKKKMRKVKNSTHVKTIDAKPGVILLYRDGKMGISPRTHTFRMRKIEPFEFQ